MKTWYCFEIATDGSFSMGAFEVESECDELFHREYNALVGYMQEAAFGITAAASWEEAINNIRTGDWQFDLAEIN